MFILLFYVFGCILALKVNYSFLDGSETYLTLGNLSGTFKNLSRVLRNLSGALRIYPESIRDAQKPN